ncbi:MULTISPECIES: fatty acyl-AMP ligase [unclassified Streptomyces]|uniref:fatty acyl-AMP ligase n=1 Tax=unclassified Streptomyces TaxID=2593676 RepID=UPI0020337BEB|nr:MULTISPECIES: fatty acyl-AMP ligase [unclassified Streptomyces]MCM2421597.1 fatty acyl-AMP ligase [Streptomyces sp. RKAG293]MCM2426198.1 fatty acyl-AMP ligase [Streptomyces sp. RKAG337]
MSLSGFATFTELVLERAAELADADAHVFLRDAGPAMAAEHLTYGELDREARRIASVLQLHGVEGQPVLLLYPTTAEFLKAFIGCLYAGAVAVPAPLPGDAGQEKRLSRTSAVIRDSGAKLVLTDRANAPDIALWLSRARREDVVCLATDNTGFGDPAAWQPVAARPDDLAFLQYTSGSVSDPRGVMVSHRNLMANEAAIGRSLGTTPEDRFGGWLPHFHDMGFIAHLLHPLWLGSSSVQMSPTSFIKRPVRWLQAIDEYGVTAGGGPNFCFELCLRRVTDEQIEALDLSRWRLALNGAEPVRADTLKAFAERFAPAGLRPQALYPCYGLAEATLIVSGGVPDAPFTEKQADTKALERDQLAAAEPGRPQRTLVSSGHVTDFDVRIVDPAGYRELPAGAVGEIWLRGDSVAQGYWQRPEESDATFHGTLNDGETGFLRTGDLGVLEDGELFVTGRLKEVIIINGRNVYPQDVEFAVRAISPALAHGAGAAFSVEAGREQLVVVQEVKGEGASAASLRALAQQVQAMIGQDFNIPAGNVLLVRPGTVRRTTSGKVQRTLMRQLFLDGELRGEYEALDPAVHAVVRARDTLLGEDLLQPEPAGGRGRPW